MDHAPASTVRSTRDALGALGAGAAPVRVEASVLPAVSIVVPTFREALNIEPLARRVERAVLPVVPALELTFVDDDSGDGTEERVAALGLPWVRVLVRRGERGLSSAVIHGCRAATHDVLVVMDADLSHPPEAIPSMVRALDDGADFALGSRYVAGGSTDASWSVFRRLNSRVATLLALALTPVRDPMSGFFALRRGTFERAERLDPVGFKIGLELMVKCRCREVREIPIHFADRVRGESKLSVRQQAAYLRHLGRLWAFRLWRR